MIHNSQYYEFVRNIFGDVIALYKNSTCVARYSYDAWGKCTVMNADGTVTTSSTHIGNVNPFRYRGYYYDTESGLYYLLSRYYDPEIGQFISPDTFDYLKPNKIGGVNLYAYGLNNPVMYVDPTGHLAKWLIALIVGVAVVAVVAVVNHVVSGVECLIAEQNVEDSYTKEEAETAIREVLGEGYKGEVKVTDTNLHIDNSNSINSRYKRILISKIYQNTVKDNGEKITNRSVYSLSAEWAAHNFAAFFKFEYDRTSNVDLDSDFYANQWYTRYGTYFFMGLGIL